MLKTNKERKDALIKVWTYLSEHPECQCKAHLPIELLTIIQDELSWCPWCTIYREGKFPNKKNCSKCPLAKVGHICCDNDIAGRERKDYYSMWNNVFNSDEIRIAGAKGILEVAKNWEVRGEKV